VVLTLQRFAFLAELRFKVLRCRCCNTNVAQLDGEGVETIADLDKVTAVTIIDAVNEVRTFRVSNVLLMLGLILLVEGITGSTDVFRDLSNGDTDDKQFRR